MEMSEERRVLIDEVGFSTTQAEYEEKADHLLEGSDTIIIVGDGSRIQVRNRALHCYQGRTHVPQEDKEIVLHAGTHNIKRLVILSDNGYLTFDAVNWCINQGIIVIMLDRDGNLLFTSGDIGCDVKLRRKQYEAFDTGIAGHIAQEVIRRKTLAQIDVLKQLNEYKFRRDFKQYRVYRKWNGPLWELLEQGLEEIPYKRDFNSLMILEARLANSYWDAFVGIPLQWKPRDAKIVPPHWLVVGERLSSLSGTTARHAINPFQSALNYAYAILEAQVLAAINTAGLDASVGCLHQDRTGRNSLVFDFMEPHRPQVDRLVLDLFVKTTLSRGMFVPLESGEVRLSKQFARYVAALCTLPLSRINETVRQFVRVYSG